MTTLANIQQSLKTGYDTVTTKLQNAGHAYREWRVANPKAALVSDIVVAAAAVGLGAYIGWLGAEMSFSAMSSAVEAFGQALTVAGYVFAAGRAWYLAKNITPEAQLAPAVQQPPAVLEQQVQPA